MKVYQYKNIYPRTFWIANMTEESLESIVKRFIFFKNIEGWSEVNDKIMNELYDASEGAIAGCYPVQDKSSGTLGVLLLIFRIDDMDTDITAHESVHIADYYFEATGCNSEDFTDGNEAYAYLVGWAAGCIANALIKEKNGKTIS